MPGQKQREVISKTYINQADERETTTLFQVGVMFPALGISTDRDDDFAGTYCAICCRLGRTRTEQIETETLFTVG